MKPNRTYKHKNCKDVAFRPVSVADQDGTILALGYWVNLTMTPSRVIDFDEIEVDVEDLDKWKEIEL